MIQNDLQQIRLGYLRGVLVGALAGAFENTDIARVQPRQQCHGSHVRATGLSGGGDQFGRPARRV